MMNENFHQFTEEYVSGIKSMCDPLYVVLYGSSSKGEIKSDMDMFSIVKEASQDLIDAVSDFTIDFHKKHGLREDYDVPYQSKTLYTYEDLAQAVSAVSFIYKYNQFLIPPIIMRPDFLGSKEMKYRLLLNALTSKYRILFGDKNGDIKDMEKQAWETIFRIIFSQNADGIENISQMYTKMVVSEDGSNGKGYLGYMEKNREDIEQKLKTFMDIFEIEGKIKKTDRGYQCDQAWMNDLIDHNKKAKDNINKTLSQKEDMKKIDFATNKNPFGPISNGVSTELLSAIKDYPDYSNTLIDNDLSNFLGVDHDCISVCQGSLDAIYNIPQCIKFDHCIIVEPTYRGYSAAIQNMGKQYDKFDLDDNFELDIDKLSGTIKENSIVFLCNPNNPTGTYISHDALVDLIQKHPSSHFVIDESHLLFNHEFDSMSLKKDVEILPNLTVVISLSKFFNIPGIRMGAVISNPVIIDKFKAKNVPYYINNVSTEILRSNIIDQTSIDQLRDQIHEVKNSFYGNLIKIPWLDVKHNEYNNFFMCKIIDQDMSARKLERELGKRGLMIRLCNEIPGEWIRISINTTENNNQLISLLKDPSLISHCMKYQL